MLTNKRNNMIGVDIEEIERFNSWSKENFERIFSSVEIEYANSKAKPLEHFCGFYCVREALIKALNKKDLVLNKMVIEHDKNGKPYFLNNEYLSNIMKDYNIDSIEISISHSRNYSVGVVLINKI